MSGLHREKDMKVGLLTRFFNLKNAGIGRYSVAIRDGLHKNGIEVHSVSSGQYGERSDIYYLYNTFGLPFKIPRDCDIYHALSPIEALYLPLKDKTIVTVHDLIPLLHIDRVMSSNPKLGEQLTRSLERRYFGFACRMVSRCTAIICVSCETKKELTTHFDIPEDKIHVVHQGIKDDLWRSVKPRDDENVFRIGSVCSLDPRKRIDTLVRAFLEADVKDSELLIGGTGMEKDKLMAMADGDTRIKFVGFVPDDQLGSFYASLDLFCFPSYIEGYGIPVVEALSCGTPVLTLEDAIMPEEIRNRTHVSSIKDFAETLRSFHDNRREVTSEILEWARDHTWDRTVNSTIEVYQKVMASSS